MTLPTPEDIVEQNKGIYDKPSGREGAAAAYRAVAKELREMLANEDSFLVKLVMVRKLSEQLDGKKVTK